LTSRSDISAALLALPASREEPVHVATPQLPPAPGLDADRLPEPHWARLRNETTGTGALVQTSCGAWTGCLCSPHWLVPSSVSRPL
jgi:hypothetical protein